MTEYTRAVEDDLDWSLLNQLHAVVLQVGTFKKKLGQRAILSNI